MARRASSAKTSSQLPAEFQDLASFVDWALATEKERTQKRLTSTMEDISGFYEAMLPRMDAIVGYLKQFPPDNLPPEVRTLYRMSLSVMEVANAVELYKQPRLPVAFDPARFEPIE
jgi:hypothetical protein